MAGTIINTGFKIGDGVIQNTASTVGHDCIIDDFCHVSVGTHLCGTVYLGAGTWGAACSIVINYIIICSDCLIGAGAVVVKNIDIQGIYTGVPAEMLKLFFTSGA